MTSVIKASGLDTADNPLSSVKDGSLKTANNCVIRSKNILEPRRGLPLYGGTFGSGSDRANTFTFFDSGTVVQYGTSLAQATGLATYSAISGTYTPPDSATLRMKFVEASQNLFFTTTVGMYEMDALTSTPRKAGAPKAYSLLDTGGSYISPVSYLAGGPTSTSGWLAADSAVAYRMQYGRKDSHGVTAWGEPSGRVVVPNPAALTLPIGSLTRPGSGYLATTTSAHGYRVGEQFSISPGEANYPAGSYTVVTVPSSTTFTFDVVGAAAASTAAQTLTTGTQFVTFTFVVPADADTNCVYRVYRTLTSSAATIDPGDEQFLVYEAPVTAAMIGSTGSYSDITPAAALSSVPLYTNELTGEGALQANVPPPLAKDVAFWNDRVWFSHTTSKHRFSLQMIGTGSPNGVQANDTITVNGITFTAVTSGSASDTFYVTTMAATPSKNVDDTTHQFQKVLDIRSQAGTLGVRAAGVSGPNTPAGMLAFEEIGVGGSTFYVSASRPGSWSPILPQSFTVTAASTARTLGTTVTVTTGASHGFAVGQVVRMSSNTADANFAVGLKTVVATPSGTTFTYTEAGANVTLSGTYLVAGVATGVSNNDAAPHRVFYSKVGQPEAVPLLNYVDVGAKNKAILRIVPLREKLIVFKEDAIYTVSGDAPNLRVDLLDNTTWLLAPDSAVAANNQIFALTNQGVVTVTEGGVGLVSRPIEDQIESGFLAPIAAGLPSVKAMVWGAAYESERLYILGLTTNSSSTTADQIFVYNYLGQSWLRWPVSARFAAVEPSTDLLFLAAADTDQLLRERKTFTYADYADREISVTVSSASGTSIVLTSATGVAAGDVIKDTSSDSTRLITAVDSNTLEVVEGTGAISTFAGAAKVYKAIPVSLEFNPVTAVPGEAKQFSSTTLHFNSLNAYDFDLTTRTELSTTAKLTSLTSPAYSLADGPVECINIKKPVALEDQRAALLRVGMRITEAWAKWQINGFTVEDRNVSERNSR